MFLQLLLQLVISISEGLAGSRVPGRAAPNFLLYFQGFIFFPGAIPAPSYVMFPTAGSQRLVGSL